MSELATIAVLGTGTMGAPMARNLLQAGHEVRVWNRSADKAQLLAGDGATVADSAREAAEGADVVVTMLAAGDAVEEVAREAIEGDVVWAQMSTVGLEAGETLASLARERGVTFVDSPVLGTKAPAEQGKLVVLASGPEAVRERVDPVFEAIGSRTLWVGEAGAGSRLKLCANAWVATVLEGVADSLALTRALGLDPQLFLDAIEGGAMDAPYVRLKGGMMLNGSYDTAFALDGALKDVDLILAVADDVGLDLGPMPGVRAHLARAVDAGHGDKDMAATWLGH